MLFRAKGPPKTLVHYLTHNKSVIKKQGKRLVKLSKDRNDSFNGKKKHRVDISL